MDKDAVNAPLASGASEMYSDVAAPPGDGYSRRSRQRWSPQTKQVTPYYNMVAATSSNTSSTINAGTVDTGARRGRQKQSSSLSFTSSVTSGQSSEKSSTEQFDGVGFL